MRNKQGFTLLEILVVLIIVGITISFALLAFGDFGGQRRVLMASERFIQFTKLVQQQAILETGTWGIVVKQNSYQAWRYVPEQGWQAVQQSPFREQHFPANTSLRLQPSTTAKPPQIIINATGEMTPFQLNIYQGKDTKPIVIRGQHNGELQGGLAPS